MPKINITIHNMNSLIGKKFNKLTILSVSHEKRNRDHRKRIYCKCKCDCGNITECRYDAIKIGHTWSCGCIEPQYGNSYNGKKYRLYNAWYSMKRRCYDINYKDYGARGITVCDKWKNNFINFYNWAINNGYNDNLTLDRIDINGNYEPTNCRWITVKEQANNKRNNYYITINEETKALVEWCEQYNIKYSTVRTRINRLKWDPLKALTTPIKS